jgi:hypothetical protein
MSSEVSDVAAMMRSISSTVSTVSVIEAYWLVIYFVLRVSLGKYFFSLTSRPL